MTREQMPETSVLVTAEDLNPASRDSKLSFRVKAPDGTFQTTDEQTTRDKIVEIMRPLSPRMRNRVAKKLQRQLDEALDKQKVDLAEKERQRMELDRKILAMEKLEKWCDECKPQPWTLERNECSRLHKLKEAATQGRIMDADGSAAPCTLPCGHPFVVRHDWARAFESSSDTLGGDIQLPFEDNAFEFRIYGKTIIILASRKPDESQITSIMFYECDDYWFMPPGSEPDPVFDYLWRQVEAICVALDAEVATHTVVRAPVKLNEKRAKAGKLPLADYSVIDLSRRHRLANPVSAGNTGSRKRLHFRRGHWRHFETSKSWVKWCLVGDPDLGFIQQHYKL